MKGEVDFKKIPGKENGADAFTKPLTGDELKRLVEKMGVEFYGTDEGRNDDFERDLGELCLRRRINDQTKLWGFGPEVRVWARTDLKARNLKTSGGGGPKWKSVLGRMSVDREEGRVIETTLMRDMTRRQENKRIQPTELTTVLWYRQGGEEGGDREQTKHGGHSEGTTSNRSATEKKEDLRAGRHV